MDQFFFDNTFLGQKKGESYLAEQFRQITHYLAEQFRQITHYLAEQFRQIAHYLAEHLILTNNIVFLLLMDWS